MCPFNSTIVTEVRDRAFKSNPEKATVTGSELESGSVYDYGLRNEDATTEEGGDDIMYGRFLDELAWEFNQEGHRRQDMIRFGIFTEKSWFSHSPDGDFRALYPIPQQALNNNPNLTQNPGY
ncbi:RagB/SusD family nutrient uptake outer membrane protein [Christiangramia flava]|uniref:RagB/SusD family nutrient uptake outer membrane protein n=1 Tax=Christiangramia flava TaxID=1486245 RepID=UPI0009FA7FB9|nr:RagB/SusD family nutrient uptake outer membrane protein [Christiangramia flava]